MKKRFLVMAMAGVALASCVSEDVSDVKQKEEKVKIKFDAPAIYNNATSRVEYGEITGNAYPEDESFMVAAKYENTSFDWDTATDFWSGFEKVSYDSGHSGWKTEDDYYWPAQGLAFVAYSPAGLDSNVLGDADYTSTGWEFTDFIVPSDQENGKIDLLYSEVIRNQTNNVVSGNYYGVPVLFKHALSSVHFVVRKADGVDVEVKLQSIKIDDVKYKGDFSVNSWTTDNDLTAYAPYAESTPKLVFDTSVKHVGENGGYSLLVMPQDLDGAKLTVVYTVNGSENAPKIDLDKVQDVNGQVIDKWEPGKKYTYLLNYSTSSKDLILFAPSVQEWDPVNITIELGS